MELGEGVVVDDFLVNAVIGFKKLKGGRFPVACGANPLAGHENDSPAKAAPFLRFYQP